MIKQMTISTLTAQFNAEHRAVELAARSGAAHAVAAGKILLQIRGLLKHGEWTAWLKDNRLPERTAYRYLQLNREYGDKPATVAGLSLRAAVNLIARTTPEAPDPLIEVQPSLPNRRP